MIERRKLNIEWKIFHKKDIRKLAQFVLDACKEEAEENEDSIFTPYVRFQLWCEDGTSYEAKSIEIFEDEGPLDRKKVYSLEMKLLGSKRENYISLALDEGKRPGTLIVEGTESAWVHSTFKGIEDIISSVQPQESRVQKYQNFLLHIIAFGVGSIFVGLFNLFITPLIVSIPPDSISISALAVILANLVVRYPWTLSIFNIFIRWFWGLSTFAFPIREWVIKLWPKIEFDFGPEHLKEFKEKRRRIWFLISLFVIPIILEVILRLVQ